MMKDIPDKVLVDQKVWRSRLTFRTKGYHYLGQLLHKTQRGYYWVTKSFWQDLDRTWTTEIRVWETLYDCVFAPFLRGLRGLKFSVT